MALWQVWWVWMAAALALATLEVIVPGYFFLGFATGALVLSVLMLLGMTSLGLPAVLVIFALLSLASYLLFRRIFGIRGGSVKVWDRDINDN